MLIKGILIKRKKYNTQEEEQRIAQVLTCFEVSKAVLSTGTSGAEGKQKLLLQGLWKEEKVILGHSDLISSVHKQASPIWKSSCNNVLLSYAQYYSSMSSSKLWGCLHNSEPSDWNKMKALKGMQHPISKPLKKPLKSIHDHVSKKNSFPIFWGKKILPQTGCEIFLQFFIIQHRLTQHNKGFFPTF